jgi:hypothetical protein
MRKWLQFLVVTLITLSVLFLHFIIVYTLPYPYDKINILFIYLVFYLLWVQSGSVVWVAFLTHIFLEAFPGTAFGVTLLSSSLSLLLSYWLYMYYITNRKWYSASILMMLTLLCYRLFYSLFLFIAQRLETNPLDIKWSELWQLGLWEILLTSVVFTVIYFLFYKFSKNFHRALTK